MLVSALTNKTLCAVANSVLIIHRPQHCALLQALQGVVFAFPHPRDYHLHLSCLSGNRVCVCVCVCVCVPTCMRTNLINSDAAEKGLKSRSRDSPFESMTSL